MEHHFITYDANWKVSLNSDEIMSESGHETVMYGGDKARTAKGRFSISRHTSCQTTDYGSIGLIISTKQEMKNA